MLRCQFWDNLEDVRLTPESISMSGLQLRDARASDRGAIEAVTLSAFQEYAASMPNRWEDYRQNMLATLGAVQPAAQIVAEQESEIIGSCSIRREP